MRTQLHAHIPTLPFDNDAFEFPVDSGNVRQAAIDAAEAKANAEWKERYERFILTFASVATEPFSAEDVRERYNSLPDVPHTDKEQASGGIFQRLLRQGKLRRVGTKISRNHGNYLTTYLKG